LTVVVLWARFAIARRKFGRSEHQHRRNLTPVKSLESSFLEDKFASPNPFG
jgi:hypothetical protein